MFYYYLFYLFHFIFFFKLKTAYELRISDWSSDVCSSDLHDDLPAIEYGPVQHHRVGKDMEERQHAQHPVFHHIARIKHIHLPRIGGQILVRQFRTLWSARGPAGILQQGDVLFGVDLCRDIAARSEEHTSDLQSLMRH